MNFILRPINLEQDIEDITNLTKQLGYPTNAENLYDRFKIISFDKNYHTLAVEFDHHIIAYTGFIRLKSWEIDGEFIKIQVFVVDENYRSQGIGRLLLNAVENFAKEHQIFRILLNSSNRPEREIAHKFYKDLGFEAKSTGFHKWVKFL
ncbi:GNAT family N-acetyltransferase [Acinetobacter sp. WCHAc060025]|uniref:GNAT family N-acetyltransferase n=1 Tax=Acinetobacter sp. WCHAc060025 TaxID=2518625 RepID=UPI00102391F3|nr:GNAT family N-acetyltransferase [Acinetobacter sp. WCHAc060025]RZG76254.1 GNAT family N-acetyltransferase [Acinetobacter sp. WCHAc060025]